GRIAGAALDVFDVEPCTDSPLFALDNVVVTPHLGASTREAQDKAGDTIADMVKLALAGDFVPFAVNVSAAEANETLRPYLPLAERLGRLFASLVGQSPKQLEIIAEGEIGQYDTRILSLSALKGFFGAVSDEPVSYVNAPQLAKAAGVEVRETSTRDSHNFVNLVTLRTEKHSIAATLIGRRGEARLVMIEDHATDVPPADNMLVVRNDDRPGVIGLVGTVLGNAGVNINDMDVGRSSEAGSALMVIAPSGPVPAEVLQELRAAAGITSVHVLSA
ncbi:MAG: ACT domain-containing protein, partial [Actinomycetota bacterium]